MEDQIQNPPQVPPLPPSPLSKPKNYSNIIIVILLIIIAVLVGMESSETTFVSNLRAKYLKPAPTPTVAAAPTPTPDPTANWKTYTNDNLKFTFKYPSSLTISGEYYYDKKYVQDETDLFGFQLKNDTSQTVYTLTLYNISPLSLIDWISENIRTNKRLPPRKDITDQQKKQISAIEGQEIIYKYGIMFVFLDNNNKDRIFLFQGTDSIDQILSTFKFTSAHCTGKCPQLVPPAPNFCTNGTIVSGETNECGCLLGPTCETFTCPPSGYVDCMPGPGAKPQCSAAAMTWYKANCPNFKGGAL